MYECESWTIKMIERQINWCSQIVLEKSLERPLDSKEIKPLNPKGDQPWIFIGRTVAEAEAPVLATWCEELSHWKRFWCWKRLRQEEKGLTEDEMVGWHHWLNGHKFEQTQGMVKDKEAWHVAVHGVTKTWIQLSNWTTTTKSWWLNTMWGFGEGFELGAGRWGKGRNCHSIIETIGKVWIWTVYLIILNRCKIFQILYLWLYSRLLLFLGNIHKNV